MKFLLAHGEKLLLLTVLAIAGWSLFGSFRTFQHGTTLSRETKALFEDIEKAYSDNTPDENPKLACAVQLSEVFEGRGALVAKDTREMRSWIIHPLPRKESNIVYIKGKLGVPTGLAARGERGQVTLSWSASQTNRVAVAAYEVFRQDLDGDWPDEPLSDGSATTAADDDVEPEETCIYKIRAVGVPAPANENEIVEKPDGVEEATVDGEKRWITGFTGEISATTPSNVEFLFNAVYEDFDVQRARITIRHWNLITREWVEYKTEQGVAEGERITGYRMVGFQREEFDSGYILVKIATREITKEGGTRKEWDGEKFVPRKVYRKFTISYIMVSKEDFDLTREIVLEAHKKHVDEEADPGTVGGRRARPRAPVASRRTGGGQVDFQELRAALVPAGERRTTTTAAVAESTPSSAAGTASVGWKSYKSDHQTIYFDVPAGWTEVAGTFTYGDEANKTLTEGFVAAYAGTSDDMVMVVQQVYAKGGRHGAGTEEIVKECAETWKKKTLEGFPAAETLTDTAVAGGKDGCLFGWFTATAKVGDKDLTVARYCGYTGKLQHMVAFICRTEDYDSLSTTFSKVLLTVAW